MFYVGWLVVWLVNQSATIFSETLFPYTHLRIIRELTNFFLCKDIGIIYFISGLRNLISFVFEAQYYKVRRGKMILSKFKEMKYYFRKSKISVNNDFCSKVVYTL